MMTDPSITPTQLRRAAGYLRIDAIYESPEDAMDLEIAAQFCEHVAEQIEND